MQGSEVVAASPSAVVAVPARRRLDRLAKRHTQQALRYLAALALATCFVFPFLVVLSTSFKPVREVFTFPPHLWSDHWTLANYGEAFHGMPFWRYLINTTFLASVSVVGQLIASPLVAYSLSKIRWRGRNSLLLLILATMMLPPQVTLIPLYVLWNKVGLTGYWPLLIPQFFGYAFFIFMLRQFFMGIPDELLDAARVDGASEFRVYRTIALPLARAALTTVAIFQFMWTWTDFLLPLIYINDPKRYTLSIGLYNFFADHGVEWGALMAASTLMSLPLVVLFVFAQRQFVQGVTLTGVR
jgi:multiple sugar transport system permease protein